MEALARCTDGGRALAVQCIKRAFQSHVTKPILCGSRHGNGKPGTPYSDFFQQGMDLQVSVGFTGPPLGETCKLCGTIIPPVQKQTANLDIQTTDLMRTGNHSRGVEYDGQTVEVNGVQFLCRNILADQTP